VKQTFAVKAKAVRVRRRVLRSVLAPAPAGLSPRAAEPGVSAPVSSATEA